MYVGLASYLVKHACVVRVIQMMILALLNTMSVGHRPFERPCVNYLFKQLRLFNHFVKFVKKIQKH